MSSYIQNEKDVLIDVDDDLLHSATRDLSVSSCAIAMLFGTIIFTTVTLAARLWLVGLWSWEGGGMPIAPSMAALELSGSSSQSAHMDRNSEKSQPLDTTSLTSIYNLLHHSSIFGIILLYSYICEHHPPYPHDEKVYDRDEFFFWTILVVVVAGWNSVRRNTDVKNRGKRIQHVSTERLENIVDRSVKKSEDKQYANQPTIPPENEVLNRNQTEEWKGWMQFTFLLYHYMHATEVYNGIRVMITCYVWMTGFGNFSFFYMTNDYSLPRVLQMLWRLNFLVLFLCLTHGNPYILYYICPLHTYFFLMVYAVMYVGKEKNYTKWWIRTKLGVLAFIIFLVWDVDSGIFERVHRLFFLGYEPTTGAPMGSMWEWYFRSYLDHWSTLLGMIFAVNFPIVSLFYRKLEAQSRFRQWLGKSAVAAGILCALAMWTRGSYDDGQDSIQLNKPLFWLYTSHHIHLPSELDTSNEIVLVGTTP
eukprot:g4517.t1 g4517   contig15:1189792-1191316(-)